MTLDTGSIAISVDGVSSGTLNALLPEVYGALRQMAHRQLRRERSDHTLDTSALVHEAYLKLARSFPEIPRSREKFLCLVAQLMRQVLVDYARKRGRQKRGGDAILTTFTDSVIAATEIKGAEILDIDQALKRLEAMNPRHCQIVECRFFAGMNVEETAVALDISPRTVKRSWRVARAWLLQELSASAA